jgi:hypothetical protein
MGRSTCKSRAANVYDGTVIFLRKGSVTAGKITMLPPAKARPCSGIPLFFLLGCSILCAQTVTVSPLATIQMTQSGPVAAPQTVSILASDGGALNWTATISEDAPWIALSATQGSTPTTIWVGLVEWRAVGQPTGSYSGQITFMANGASTVVQVTWVVVPRMAGPVFSYLSGPAGCTQPDGYPDAALCTVPEEAPPGNFTPPPVGGSYVDANFGASVKVVTSPGVYHTYSANNPLSAGNKYVMTYLTNGSFDVVLAATGAIAFHSVNANQDFFWDSYDDSVYYYPNATAFMKHDLNTGQDSTVVDYAADGHGFTLIKRGGTTGSSKDNWISFFAPNEKQVCTLDLNTVKTYCADYGSASDLPYGGIDYTIDSKGVDKTSGKRYVVVVSQTMNPGFYSVNMAMGRLDLEFRGPEDPESNGNHDGICDVGEKCMAPSHSDTFEDSNGTQYLVFDHFTENPCEVSLGTYQLNKGSMILQPVELGGGKRTVMSLWKCPFPNTKGGTDEHIGCAKYAAFCVISTISPFRTAAELPLRFPHATEVMVMRGNGLEVRRLAQTRSVRFPEDGDESYWSMPRAAISNDGSLVVADSNFGVRGGVRVTLIPTGYPGR